MSDTMLLGVLCMPPEMWDDSTLDVTQRYGRYMQTARRIEEDARELEQLRAKVQAQALQILTLTGEVAGLAADAGRYRWLAGNGWAEPAIYATGPCEWGVKGVALLAGPQLADCIDGAMAESKVE